uniref:Uncharacterized protein n=1 Tax=Lotus japonicus TaxID=34305 RepID=I3T9A8_LOTJA|nr:unknown [Lotus japonicus]
MSCVQTECVVCSFWVGWCICCIICFFNASS